MHEHVVEVIDRRLAPLSNIWDTAWLGHWWCGSGSKHETQSCPGQGGGSLTRSWNWFTSRAGRSVPWGTAVRAVLKDGREM